MKSRSRTRTTFTGVRQILVDGEEYSSHLLPVFPPGSTHQIQVIMGEQIEELHETTLLAVESVTL